MPQSKLKSNQYGALCKNCDFEATGHSQKHVEMIMRLHRKKCENKYDVDDKEAQKKRKERVAKKKKENTSRDQQGWMKRCY